MIDTLVQVQKLQYEE